LMSMLDPANCIQFLVVAHLCNSGDLEKASLDTLLKNKVKVKNLDAWKDMKKEYPGLAMMVCEKLMEQ
jgi:hypothetical protein